MIRTIETIISNKWYYSAASKGRRATPNKIFLPRMYFKWGGTEYANTFKDAEQKGAKHKIC